MIERTVKLTIEEDRGHRRAKQEFVISLTANGAEIRRESAPIIDRDRTAVAYIGYEPSIHTVVLRVEEQL